MIRGPSERRKKKLIRFLTFLMTTKKHPSWYVDGMWTCLLLQSKNIYFSHIFKRFAYFLDKGDEVLRAFSIGCYLLQAILYE
jgi:hypothetical protein